MKVAIVGGRDFPAELMPFVRDLVWLLQEDAVVVSGGARGVDTAAVNAAKELGLPEPEVIRPPYGGYPPKIAPLVRNWDIARACDCMVAFWTGQSTGTAHAIACAVAENKLVTPLLANRLEAGCGLDDAVAMFRAVNASLMDANTSSEMGGGREA